jgi:hypothetical protein
VSAGLRLVGPVSAVRPRPACRALRVAGVLQGQPVTLATSTRATRFNVLVRSREAARDSRLQVISRRVSAPGALC